MKLFGKYRENENFRKMNVRVMKNGIDVLLDRDADEDLRKQTATEMKSLLDVNANLESTNDKLEYSTGRLIGIIAGGCAVFGGYFFGRFINNFVKK